MRFGIFMAAAVAALGISTAQAGTIHNAWEKHKANHALKLLSRDAQAGMTEILSARMHLVQGDSDAASPLLIKAQRNFSNAARATGHFISAEDQLNVALSKPVSRGHKPVQGSVQWVPVGGEFIVSETLEPEKRAALQKTNKDIKAGSGQVDEDLEVVGDNADFIMALAPLDQTLDNLERAQVLTEARHPHAAIKYIDRTLDGIVYVDDDFAAEPMDTSSNGNATSSAPVTSEEPVADDNAVQQEAIPAVAPTPVVTPVAASKPTAYKAMPYRHCPLLRTAPIAHPTDRDCCSRAAARRVENVAEPVIAPPTISNPSHLTGVDGQ